MISAVFDTERTRFRYLHHLTDTQASLALGVIKTLPFRKATEPSGVIR